MSTQNEQTFKNFFKKKRERGSFIRAQVKTAAQDHNLHKEDTAPEKGRVIQGYIWFLLLQELQIILMINISENYRLYLMLLVCARMQALEVWEQNLGRFLLLSLV